MGVFRFPGIILSKYTILAVAQLVVNIGLALWLYNEYTHNPFMQTYVSSTWSGIWPVVAVVVVVAIGTASFLGYRWRQGESLTGKSSAIGLEAGAYLSTIDICPFCNVPLKTLAEGRLQCRSCRRYFKSSLPKIAA